ncbi:unnamed protein product [Adineta steineri]|uniref:Uncharacterized protein n=1 Tax=Adineta steineri TaxID=433720 RepID=A0A813RUZ1_9BILA|nr:unnamed protein product [Adineta steineri]CAF0885490.1 unnamed protein product [Adineta steineri]CAF3966585.1 unnamed protein product [Adineta steineri]CAF4113085.1 unnamed protein product [Adineta steineri]
MGNPYQTPVVRIPENIINLFHGYKPPKNDWLQHKQDFYKIQFDEVLEIQRMLTHACNMIKLDDNEETINKGSLFKLMEEKEMTSKEQEEDEVVAQILQLGDQYKNGLFKTTKAFIDEVKKIIDQVKK